ncbi:halocyanin domain-containing protein [Natronorarus salvus]|uniref:halocyanin domain-containing protein n=1 Tax=Natronorarus salvus TaxID=3117733 RepID=UPI002F26AC35
MAEDTTGGLGRRSFTVAIGAGIAAGLAGCSAFIDEDELEGPPAELPQADPDAEVGDDDEPGDAEFVEDEPEYDDWFDDVENYEGTLEMTGRDEVEVANGAGEQGLTFDPPAILVDPGTEVTWEWTGEGGSHDVTEVDGAFGSDLAEEAGHTFSHTFEEEGTFRYVCSPHEGVGMKGAVVVE